MNEKYDEKTLVEKINGNIVFVQKVADSHADECVEKIFATLEYAVKLFWIRRLGGVKRYHDNMSDLTADPRFRSCFGALMLSDMDVIRTIRNKVVHKGEKVALAEANEMFSRVMRCIRAIETAIPLRILEETTLSRGNGGESPVPPSLPTPSDSCDSAKKIFNVGDTFTGRNHVDMLNRVLGTNYKAFMRCWVSLQKFGGNGIAWFVNMDGTIHGSAPDYLWKNTLSADGKTIVEECVGTGVTYVEPPQAWRLAFRLDPFGTGNRYQCEFVGYFKMTECSADNLKRTYTRIQETYTLNRQ